MVGGKLVFGILEYGNPPSYNPPHPGMASSVWKPTLPVQPSSYFDRLLNSQTIPSSSQIPTYPLAHQQAQIHVSQPLQPIPAVLGSPHILIRQLVQGPSPSQFLAIGTP